MNHFPPANASPLPKRRILIVENDRELITVYQMRLEAEGFDVKSETSPERVYQTVLEYKPDMVLLDVRLGAHNGLDILADLRARPETANVRVIVITVLALDSVEQRAISLGSLEYLVKTNIILADIVEHIKEHLGMVSPLEEDMVEETPANVV